MAETQDTFNQRMLPSVDRKVSEIKEDDMRVRVLGTVIDKTETSVVIDDGTGTVTANFEEPVQTEVNKQARVFGRVVNTSGGLELMGELVQDMSGLDTELRKRVDELWQKV
jgi:hypothetical protein